jgi:hypothetical protein
VIDLILEILARNERFVLTRLLLENFASFWGFYFVRITEIYVRGPQSTARILARDLAGKGGAFGNFEDIS